MLDEILEIKEKLQNLIIDFDGKVKNNLIVEAKYNAPLKEEIAPLLILEGQINMHKQAIKALNDGKSIEEIQEMVNNTKQQLINNTYNFQRKLVGFLTITNNLEKYSQIEREELDNYYKELVLKHHPALTLIQSQEERNKFAIVREFYLKNDIENFNHACEEFKFGTYEVNGLTDEEALKEINVAYDEFEREFARVSKYDENFAKLKVEVEDEILLARNQANLRQRLYNAKKEIVEVFEQTAQAFNGQIDFDVIKQEQ